MIFPNIDPVFLRLGPLEFRWYGLMYIVGFVCAYFLIKNRVARRNLSADSNFAADFIYSVALGIILGGRTGYILFYNLPEYLAHPLKIFAVWEGGMSFHGGLLGGLLGGTWFVRKRGVDFLEMADIAFITAPIGLFFGRIGNFINGELYGRVTDLPWGVVFPDPRGGYMPRHPSQLYEALLEGPLLFLILWFLERRRRFPGLIFGAFIALYGLFRFIAEFFREPDVQLGFLAGGFTMGQLLSLPMMLAGSLLILFAARRSGRGKIS